MQVVSTYDSSQPKVEASLCGHGVLKNLKDPDVKEEIFTILKCFGHTKTAWGKKDKKKKKFKAVLKLDETILNKFTK